MERFLGCPTFCQYWTAILSATSTAVEPSSEKKMCSRFSGQNPSQAAAQILDGIVREPGQQNVVHFGRLFRDGGDNCRMAVSVEIHPPRRNAVD